MSITAFPAEPEVANYIYETEIEGSVYQIEYAWNSRAQLFALTIRTEAGETLLAGLPIVLGQSLTGPYQNVGLPPGDIYAWDTSGTNREATLEDFGDRVLLQYLESV